MTEISNQIQSIRTMEKELISIKKNSQKNTDKMRQELAQFRNLLSLEITNITTNNCRSGKSYKRREKKDLTEWKKNLALDYPNPNSKNQITEIENLRKKSNVLLIELENYSEPLGHSKIQITPQDSVTLNYPASDEATEDGTTKSTSSPPFNDVNVLFVNQSLYDANLSASNQTFDDPKNISSPSDRLMDQFTNVTKNHSENDILTKDKIDALTEKLKDIQKQNDELRHVNENIQNLLVKLNDLKYVEDETIDVESQISLASLSRIYSQLVSQRVLANQQNILQLFENKDKNPRKMLTKIKIAKMIIKRIRHNSIVANQEHKYKIHVIRDQKDITLKAHHNKPLK